MAKRLKAAGGSRPQSKLPIRSRTRQRSAIERLEARIAAGPLLNPQRRRDGFLIDKYAVSYCNGSVEFIRAEVDRLSRIAVVRAAQELRDYPAARERAALYAASIQKIADLARARVNDDAIDLSAGFQAKKSNSNYVSITSPFLQIAEGLRSVMDGYKDLISHFEVRRPKASHTEALARHFVQLMSDFHMYPNRKRPPRSKSGPFARFLQDAWVDLQFPELPDFTLSNMAERLPQSMKE
jgi:hypothetical protein